MPGQFIEAGLPNITGNTNWAAGTAATWRPPTGGAFSATLKGTSRVLSTNGSGDIYLSFDASRSNSIYGKSITVQPSSYTVCYIMRMI